MDDKARVLKAGLVFCLIGLLLDGGLLPIPDSTTLQNAGGCLLISIGITQLILMASGVAFTRGGAVFSDNLQRKAGHA